ncbi:intraflagellar transport protein 20 homolog [Phlebotomus argentipes]|uniref:intraflagellar transport protein 20 homolog n=1 Tax=Phlebotomus argentipes TaxID=94469 RepID=UPI0028935AE5|nr:intraflagellar transport protein 20 homolog [Phlebotomus argentipes]
MCLGWRPEVGRCPGCPWKRPGRPKRRNFSEFPGSRVTMSEELAKIGLYIDDLYLLRVIEPEIANETNDLKHDCTNYSDKLQEFQTLIQGFIRVADEFGSEVEREKIRTIGIQNLVKNLSKQRESEQQQIQAQIVEKSLELERLKIELQHLQRIESEQQEIMDNFYQTQ